MSISSWSAVTGRQVSDAWSAASQDVLDQSGLTAQASPSGREGAVGGMSGGRRFAPSRAAAREGAHARAPCSGTGEMHCIDDREGTVDDDRNA
jgi:hypothetical protein